MNELERKKEIVTNYIHEKILNEYTRRKKERY